HIYTLSLHDALPIFLVQLCGGMFRERIPEWDRHLRDKVRRRAWLRHRVRTLFAHEELIGLGFPARTGGRIVTGQQGSRPRLIERSEEHTSELQSLRH